MNLSNLIFTLLVITQLSQIRPVLTFDPFSSHARIRVEDGNIVFEAPPRKSISFKSTLGSIYVNGDSLSTALAKVSSSSSTGLQPIPSDGTAVGSFDSRFNSLKETVDKLNDFSETLTKAKALFSSSRRNYSPKDYRRAVNNITRLSSEFALLKQRLEEDLCASNPCRHGGTCIPTFQSYLCECREGWEGVNCETDIDECFQFARTDLGCQNGATCRNLPGTYQCTCAPGFFGVHCTQRSDDCASSSNEALCGHGICLSKGNPSSGTHPYTCLCDQGWTTDGTSPACRIDVDECSSPLPHCSINPPVECINYPGGFTCGPCPAGYRKQGFHCIDIDECITNNGGCSLSPRVQCKNIAGGRECGPCPPGFVGDGVTCSYSGVCNIRNGDCSPVAVCVENPALVGAQRECRCPSGYVGSGEGPNGCLPSTSTTCDQSPCVNGICLSSASSPPSFTCACAPGFTGTLCDTQISSGCEPNPCQNNGVCINDPSGPICQCTSGYSGSRCQDQRFSCSGNFDSSTGVISYPSEEGDTIYPANSACSWRIRTSVGNVIRVIFTKLDIELSYDCHADSIAFYDGTTTTAPLIGRFCGDLSGLPENHTVTSEQPFIVVTFTSDASNQGKGFSFNWTTVKPECGGIINGSDHGAINSPGYPDKYPPSRDCYWYIYSPPGKRISFHFALLALEIHSDCKFDYLRIYDGSADTDPILGNFCNSSSPAPITTSGPYALVHFHSDRNRQDSGFHITYVTLPALPGCGGLLTGDRGSFSSPRFPNRYESNLECDWLIRIRSPDDRIELKFDSFALEHHPNCRYDYLEIRDGDQPNSPLIGRYCSDTIKPPPSILSTSNKLFVRFRSDFSREGTGFLGSYEIFCGGHYTSESGVVTSPNFPFPYPSSKNCSYVIQVPQGKVIQLEFTYFDLEDSAALGCAFDYVIVTEPGINSTSLTTRMCGSSLPDPITSALNELTIIFRTDQRTNRMGFRANYTTLDASCGGVLRDRNGIITSPNHPEEYLHGKECLWILNAPKGHIVQLTFTMFMLEGGRNCYFDYVEVAERNFDHGRFCGNLVPPPIQSSDEQLTVRFKSDSSVSYEGFVAAYSFLNGSKFCGGTRRASSGEITSPNFPSRYPKSRNCLWQIIVPEGNQVKLTFTDMDIEAHDRCAFDFVEIHNGIDITAPLVGRYCGTKLPPSVTSHTNSLAVLFVTDRGISGNGFRATYQVTATGCGGNLTSSNGVIISPNYPYPYSHFAECTWAIRTAKGSRVILNLVDIAFESHHACSLDRLEVFDGPNDRAKRLLIACGDQMLNSPLISSAETLTIKMVTDGSVSFRGFKAIYTTNCTNTINGIKGAIETPNYPSLFTGNTNCSWTIKVPYNNNISLAFQEVNLNSPCSASYLSISRPSYRKYCADNATSIGHLLLNTDTLTISYVNIDSRSPPIFRLEWALSGCGGELTATEGRITSPSYPDPYPVGIACLWTIKARPGNQIVVNLREYNIEDSSSCDYDSLQIFGGPDRTAPRLLNICGRSFTSKTVTSNGNYLTIAFKSDHSFTGKGFVLSYFTQVGRCGGYQNHERGTLTSPNYPASYDASDDCTWTLNYPDHRMKITIDELDIPTSANCTDSYLAIYNSDYSEAAKLCGNQAPTEQIIASGEYIQIRLKADGSRTGKGFNLQYEAICGSTRYATWYSRTLTNPNFPSYSTKNPNCEWVIKSNDTSERISLTFTLLIVAGSLQIRDGDSKDSPLIASFDQTNQSPPPQIISQGSSLFLREEGKVIFSATYSTEISRCGGSFTGSGLFSSPGYPNSYPLSASCIWTLYAVAGNMVTLKFKNFNLESDEFCALDYVEIRERSSGGPLIGRFCGQNIPSFTNSTLYPGLWIKFQTDGEGSAPGFEASFDMADHVTLTGRSGSIASPYYPKPFSDGREKTWTIVVEEDLVISIKFTSVYFTNDCNSFIALHDGPDSTAPRLERLCGFKSKSIVTSTANVIHLRYVPNLFMSKFFLNWKAEPRNTSSVIEQTIDPTTTCGTNINIQLNQNVTLTSPGYPFGYAHQLNCSWILTSPSGTHLTVETNDLNIEPPLGDNMCNFDKISFYDYSFDDNVWQLNRSLCGRTKPPTFELKSDLSRVTFNTDSHVNRTGFNFTLSPVCGGLLHDREGYINSSLMGTADACSWRVLVREGRTIQLVFKRFNLGTNEDPCSKAYLSVRDGPFANSPLKGQFCGLQLPAAVNSSSNHFYLSVYSPRSRQADFSIFYREVSSACGGTIELDETSNPSVRIESPNYPLPPAHASECEWLIKGPIHRNLRIDFNPPQQSTTPCDTKETRLDIHDGGTALSSRLARLCPRARTSAITTTENLMFIRYLGSGDLTRIAFQATISINICGGTYIMAYGATIQSPNYPQPYDSYLSCSYYIHSYNPNARVSAMIEDLDLPSGSTGNCDSGDYLEFRDTSPTGDLIERVCGTRNTSQTIESTSGVLYFSFKTDSDNAGKGFKIRFNQKYLNYPDCPYKFFNASNPGTIRSPGFPIPLPVSRVCTYTIEGPIDHRVSLRFTHLNLKSDSRAQNSCLDSIKVTYNYQQIQLASIITFDMDTVIVDCHETSSTLTINSPTNVLVLQFKTQGLNQGEGFEANYYADLPNECGGLVNKSSPLIVSKLFDEPFNESTDGMVINCGWKFQTEPDEERKTKWIEYETVEVLGSSTDENYCSSGRVTEGIINEARNSITQVLCGNKTNVVSVLPIATANLGLTARINRTRGYRGFKAAYHVSDCGGSVNGQLGIMNYSSPGWPSNYPVNTTCVWELNSAYQTAWQINFTDFELESDCNKDYLELREGLTYDSVLVGRYCANNRPPPYTSFGNQMVIMFKSDGSGNGRGFTFQLGSKGIICGGHFDSRFIFSPNYPDVYPRNVECIWNLEVDPVYRINLTFPGRFDIEQSANCTKDNVCIVQWISNSWSPVGCYCGLAAPKPILLNTNKARIVFRSDDDTRRGDGFTMLLTKQCGHTISSYGSGTITSPGFPAYHESANCEWILKGSSPSDIIKIEFDYFELEPGANCNFDSLKILVGDLTDPSNTLGTYCGTDLPPRIVIRKAVKIKFVSDSIISRRGFMLRYSIAPCGGTFNSSAGRITSPNVDGAYIANAHCKYQITVPEGYSVSLRLNSFSLYITDLCYPSPYTFAHAEMDYLEIWDGSDSDGHLLGRLCGFVEPKIFKTRSNLMTLVFHSDEEFSSSGFEAIWEPALGPSKGCGGMVNSSTGYIQSPDIDQDGRYENNLDCIWYIVSDGGDDALEISFTLMDIEASSLSPRIECARDYLEIRDGLSSASPLIDLFCSSEKPSKIITSSSRVYIHFSTDEANNGAGFNLTFKTIPNTCRSEIMISNFTSGNLTSPNYPLSYPPSIRCSWKFTFERYGFMATLKITDLDIDCDSKDSLEIIGNALYADSHKICGQTVPAPIHVSLDGVTLLFTSRSDNRPNRRGFALTYQLSGCNDNYTEDSGIITSPRYPYVYSSERECNFTITARPGYTISVYFHEAFFNGPVDCNNSTKFTVKDGNTTTRSIAVCRPTLLEPIFSDSSSLSFYLKGSWYRYLLLYTTTNAGPGCGGNLRAYNGTFTSPNYPKPYRKETECAWTLSSYGIHSITLRFIDFEMESSASCTFNYVEIVDGSFIQRYCGQEMPATYISRGPSITVKMGVIPTNLGRGFRAEFGISQRAIPDLQRVITAPMDGSSDRGPELL